MHYKRLLVVFYVVDTTVSLSHLANPDSWAVYPGERAWTLLDISIKITANNSKLLL